MTRSSDGATIQAPCGPVEIECHIIQWVKSARYKIIAKNATLDCYVEETDSLAQTASVGQTDCTAQKSGKYAPGPRSMAPRPPPRLPLFLPTTAACTFSRAPVHESSAL